jgi:seryl-tRNA synthetase
VTAALHRTQAKEPVGDSADLPDKVKDNLTELEQDDLQPLTVTQLKAMKELVDQGMEQYKGESEELDEKRMSMLRVIGNLVHDSVVVHDDEVRAVE